MNSTLHAMHRTARGRPPPPGRSTLRGSVVINATIALALVVVILIGSELGYLFYMKRELQKASDLAALAGTQILKADNCDVAKGVAATNAAKNLPFLKPEQYDFTAVCGRWDPATRQPPQYFSAASGTEVNNAIKVTIQGRPSLLFPSIPGNDARAVVVQSLATKSEATAAFSVGAQLLRTNGNSPLGKVLQAVGVDITKLTVLDSAGLANAKITPTGLLKALGLDVALEAGVLTPAGLAKIPNVSVGQILAVALNAVSGDAVLTASLKALQTELVNVGLDKVSLNVLVPDTGGNGLLTVKAPDSTNAAALQTQIDLGSILRTTIGIATSSKRGVVIPGLNLLGLVDVQAGVVEPPSIGIGGVGTRAYNAQVRIYIDVDSNNLLGGILSPLISGLLGTRVHLPIYVDAVSGLGQISKLDCLATPPAATIDVTSYVLKACVGKVDDPTVRFSTKNLCTDPGVLQPERLIQLLNLPVPAAATLNLDALTQTDSLTLAVGETKSSRANQLAIGSLVSNLVNALLNTLGQLLSPSSGPSSTDRANALADSYLNATKNPSGFYDANKVVALLKNGSPTSPSLGDWNRTVTVQDPLLGLFPVEKTMSVWDVLTLQTTPSGGLLGLLGLGQSCAGLLQQLLAWNVCVKSKVVDALNSAPAGVVNGAASQLPGSTPSGSGGNAGLLQALLSPVIAILKPILDGVGSLLSTILSSVLGLELGRTDVTLNALQCGRAQLVY
ncbi:TadG family pilus assembly protein [Variovorax sp. GB1P17]|uniref:TadG family pilus assembly protein n=1 Tax=Variovorax sp. GB1P17 TaxID=3443740 RepID=UPI003F476BF3